VKDFLSQEVAGVSWSNMADQLKKALEYLIPVFLAYLQTLTYKAKVVF